MCDDVEPRRALMPPYEGRLRNVERRVPPGQLHVEGAGRRRRWREPHPEAVALEDAVRLAAGVVTGAVVEQDGHVLRRALVVLEADLDRVRLVVGRALRSVR